MKLVFYCLLYSTVRQLLYRVSALDVLKDLALDPNRNVIHVVRFSTSVGKKVYIVFVRV